ncbi:MAG: hypothetical protein WC457_00705 [Patescibacteria group bacterium]
MTKAPAAEKIKNKSEVVPARPDTESVARNLHEAGQTLETEQTEPLREEVEAESVSEAAIERVMNQVSRAKWIENFVESGELKDAEARMLGSIVAERGWQTVFTELKPGDKIVNFTTPGGEMSIKNFNTLLGEQANDNIIAARKQIIAAAMKDCGLEQLMQSYNSGLFKMADGVDSGKLEVALNEASAQVRDHMKTAIENEINNKINNDVEKGMDESEARSKFDNIKNILDNRGGYRISFGVAEVPAAKLSADLSHIVDAVSMCSQSAQRARRGDAKSGRFGETYEENNIYSEAAEINSIGEKLFGQSVTDEKGNVYRIFTKDINNNRVLDRDLLRAVRKNEFKPDDQSRDTVNLVRQYIERVNLIDAVMPVTAEDAANGEVAANTARRKQFIERDENGAWKISENLTAEEREELKNDLRHDQKDARFLSPEFFHTEALKKKKCVYVNIDVLDLGVDALLGYENDLQNINRDPSKLHEISSRASDTITKRMRDIRGFALEVYKKYFGDEEVVGLVGGDELTFAVDKDKVDKDTLENFMVDLKNATGARVIKTETAIGAAMRQSENSWDSAVSSDDKKQLIAEHQAALKRAEKGSQVCKAIEKKLRAVEITLENKIGLAPAEVNDELRSLEIDHLFGAVALERDDGGFLLSYRSERNNVILGVKHEDVLSQINSAVEKINKKYGLV